MKRPTLSFAIAAGLLYHLGSLAAFDVVPTTPNKQTHQRITAEAVKVIGALDACSSSVLSSRVTRVDRHEFFHEGQYAAVHHFDREFGVNPLQAFNGGRDFYQSAISQSKAAFMNEDSDTGSRYLGDALHAIQDLIAHSNLVDGVFTGAEQQAILNAALNGAELPAQYQDRFKLALFVPDDPHLPDTFDIWEYTHGDHAKDFGGSPYHADAANLAIDTTKKIIQSFVDQLGLHCDETDTTVLRVSSEDPNDKIGSRGAGALRFISGKEPSRYLVEFENKPTATAPAQIVLITDQLDLLTLDLNTFSFGPISFGSTHLIPTPRLTSYLTTVDLRPGQQSEG